MVLQSFTAEQQDLLEALQQSETGGVQQPTPPQKPPANTPNGVNTPDGTPTTPGFNRIEGTPGPDELDGTDGKDLILSKGGDDTVNGKGRIDAISGGSENDTIHGNGGGDIIYGESSASGNLDLIGIGNDTIYGDDGADFLYGQYGEDKIYGGLKDDLIEGGGDNDEIYGNAGNDALAGDDFEDSPGVSGDDKVQGGNGNDLIYGGLGNDTLGGDAGADQVFGGQGNDALSGGTGNDRLTGTDTDFFGQRQLGFGRGETDTLIGGENDDTFVLGLAEALGRDANGNDTTIEDVVLYDDGNVNASGASDYALIKDFGFAGDNFVRGVDKIELAGSQDMYSLSTSPIDTISGTGIFLTEGQSTPELVGVVEGISQATLSLTNTNFFTFV